MRLSHARTRARVELANARADFPILGVRVYGQPLVYLDNAATTQKPRAVLDAMERFHRTEYANVHRGPHFLSERATERFEQVRRKVQRFIGAARPEEVVFVRGATEAINLVAQAWGRKNVGRGDEIIVSELEHHSNLVPWQMMCEELGAQLRVWPISDRGDLDPAALDRLLGPRTRLVAVAHVSNALGTVNPIAEIVTRAHAAHARVLVDGAQAAPHLPIQVAALGCDFYVLSGHKMYGPTGAGVLYGRYELLDRMPPWQGGGEMILAVDWKGTTFKRPPHRFEAGTPDIAAVVGLGAAIDYIDALGMAEIGAYEEALLAHATVALASVPGLRIMGQPRRRAGVLSFVMDGIHPHDVATVLDRQGIAVRAGHHCAQPLMRRLGVDATSRASFALYNTEDEVNALVRGLLTVREVLG
jgi:cysteine desulfurase/selenocysteine lyase